MKRPRVRLSSRIRLAAVLACLALLSSARPAAAASELPPNLRLPGLRGGDLTARDLAEGAHVLVVWASWSPRCRDIVERLQGLDERWGRRAHVASIDFQEERGAVEEFLRGKSLAVPVYLDRDGAFSKSLEVTTLPGLVVVRDGKVRFQGRLPADVDSLLEEHLR